MSVFPYLSALLLLCQTLICVTPDFSNILSKTAIERLADVDEYEVVREVQVSPLPIVPPPYYVFSLPILCGCCRERRLFLCARDTRS